MVSSDLGVGNFLSLASLSRTSLAALGLGENVVEKMAKCAIYTWVRTGLGYAR